MKHFVLRPSRYRLKPHPACGKAPYSPQQRSQIRRVLDADPGDTRIQHFEPTMHSGLQRLADHESPTLADVEYVEEETAQPGIQRLNRPGAGDAVAGDLVPRDRLGQHLNRAASSGHQLESSTRDFMEQRFGADFNGVRVHADNEADRLSRAIQARAFTHGSHVYFARGEYRPHSETGRHTLAHELTHVIQQGGASQSGLSAPAERKTKTGVSARLQRLSDVSGAGRCGVRPRGWPAVGCNYGVSTDGGNTVTGWKAYTPYRYKYHYWCHGHSLGTFAQYGYSVYSGSGMRTVIQDEWTNQRPANTRAGDLAVWTGRYDHSAIFTRPVVSGGQLDPARSELSSKNGARPLNPSTTLSALMSTYGGGVGVYRHR